MMTVNWFSKEILDGCFGDDDILLSRKAEDNVMLPTATDRFKTKLMSQTKFL